MADVSQEIRDQFKECLVKIRARRAASLVITNDQRAAAMGLVFDASGQVKIRSRAREKSLGFSRSAHPGLVANWPELPPNRR